MLESTSMIRVRIAPSPTGEDLHIGTAYTALLNFVFAKKNKGKFIVRIEDTDRTRYVAGGEERMLASLKWLGLVCDEGPDIGGPYGPYRQSDRLDFYKKYALELVEKVHAYYCFCTPETLIKMREEQQQKREIPRYDGRCLTITNATERISQGEKYVIRLKVPGEGKTEFNDLIRGKITFENNQIDDQVLLKSDGYPTYHLAVVVDDHLMGISHVIRGEDWISSTPKHVLLYQFFNWKLPLFAHTPLLRNPDKSKLSKRKNPVWVSWYREQGFLPEAMVNYLALMGWSYPSGEEIFSIDELSKEFTLERVQVVGPVFDVEKLRWMNGEYIRKEQKAKIKEQIYHFYHKKYPEDLIEKTIPLIQERIKTLAEYESLCEFFFNTPKEYEIDLASYKSLLEQVKKVLTAIDDWRAGLIGEQLQELAKKLGIKTGEFFMVLRVAITGKKISPPLNESMEILGREETVVRINNAL